MGRLLQQVGTEGAQYRGGRVQYHRQIVLRGETTGQIITFGIFTESWLVHALVTSTASAATVQVRGIDDGNLTPGVTDLGDGQLRQILSDVKRGLKGSCIDISRRCETVEKERVGRQLSGRGSGWSGGGR